MKLLLVDNFDSFTNNIANFLRGAADGLHIDVVRNDRFDLLTQPQFWEYDAIVISPGPGNPGLSSDLGISADILQHDARPILGVCLGHQAMVLAAGGAVELAPEPMHGRVSTIRTTQLGLFAGLPKDINVMRYHSWMVKADLPKGYVCDAWSDDGIVMGVRDLHRPRWGVQFHPESIGTAHGRAILTNFLKAVDPNLHKKPKKVTPKTPDAPRRRDLHWRHIGPAQSVVSLLEAQGLTNGRRPVLLESSLVQKDRSRFSILEVPDAEDRSVSYAVTTGLLREFRGQICVSTRKESIFDFANHAFEAVDFPDGEPPFAFRGGLIGWLGYELKSELLGVTSWPSATADAAFRFVTQYFVVDHAEDALYAAVSVPHGTPQTVVADSFAAMQRIVADAAKVETHFVAPRQSAPVEFTMRHDPQAYLDRITSCHDFIKAGESYELCLTNRITATVQMDAWEFYKLLRQRNPSTYGGFLTIDNTEVISSSPERFLRIDQSGMIESKPIKGTIRRGKDAQEDRALARELRENEKERAENIMIVDLVRHDFSAVSIPGSIEVLGLCDIETYPAVHQMVSTIRGRLKPELTAVDVLMSCFPGGSMTGAPKIRSVEILDRLEGDARGIYSGALGWIGFDGQLDLSIVIRTVVKRDDQISIGCGGAITYLSDAQDELDEIMLKSRALVRAVSEHVTGDAENFRMNPTHQPPAYPDRHDVIVAE